MSENTSSTAVAEVIESKGTTSTLEQELTAKAKEEEKAKQEAKDAYLDGEADGIAQDWRTMEQEHSTKFYAIGKRCSAWLKLKVESGSKRSDAMRILREKLLTAGCEGAEADINRAIQTYHAGELFGASFQELPVGVQKPLATFIERDPKTEEWSLKGDYAKQAKRLYDKAVKTKLTGSEVRDAVNKIKGKTASAATEREEKDVEAEEEPTKGSKEAALSTKPALAAADLTRLVTDHDDADTVLEHVGKDASFSKLHVVDILLGMQAAGRLDDLTYVLTQCTKLVRELKEKQPAKKVA